MFPKCLFLSAIAITEAAMGGRVQELRPVRRLVVLVTEAILVNGSSYSGRTYSRVRPNDRVKAVPAPVPSHSQGRLH